jgi:hypothetical protein
MNSFSLKSICLYGLTVGMVTSLFSAIASYGEANIRAPQPVNGEYLLGNNLAGCLQGKNLKLELQQSGSYLHGRILETAKLTKDRELPTMKGRLNDRQLVLSGKLPTKICPQQSPIEISGNINNRKLNGKITIDRQNNSPITTTGIEIRSTDTH